MGKPTLPCCVYSETIKDCNSIGVHVFFHLYGRSGRKAIYHSRIVCYGLIKPLFLGCFALSVMVNSLHLPVAMAEVNITQHRGFIGKLSREGDLSGHHESVNRGQHSVNISISTSIKTHNVSTDSTRPSVP